MKLGGGVALSVVALLAAAALLLAGSVLLVTVVLAPAHEDPCLGDVVDADHARRGGGARALTTSQRANAEAIIAEGRLRRLPDRAIVIALAVASQESHFTNYANDGRGVDLLPPQMRIERSLRLPHEAVGSDHGSLGVFQQQWPWWGMMRQLMNPTAAAGKFYQALVEVSGWERLPVTVAAQRVQRSAYPSAYADDEPLARALLAAASGGATVRDASSVDPAGGGCVESAAWSGSVVFPLPAGSGYTDLHNWGERASVWSSGHTGTDLAVACGTPVLAATAGTVIIRTDQPWAGRWLVEVSTGAERLTTWYAHMRTVDVRAGQRVSAGEQLGEVGNLGNATGCHLHFEVHPHGGSIYQDDVNPSVWLHQHVGHLLNDRSDGGGVVVATFNTLGSSHTSPHGNKPWFGSGPRRTRGLVTLLHRYRVDVAGVQEFQRPQDDTFRRLVGARYGVYHPPGDTENAIIWRRDRWRLAAASWFVIPYFDGHPRRMPIVRLDAIDPIDPVDSAHLGRAVTVVDVHNPADTQRFPRQGRWRRRAVTREIALLHRLTTRSQGPVILTGDLNDRHQAVCRLTARAGMHPATGGTGRAGGTGSTGCSVSARSGIDWILGNPDVRFTASQVVHDSLVRRTSDHPLVLTRLNVETP